MSINKKRYLAEGGGVCLHCESRNIMALEQIQGDDGGASCQVECHDCGRIWTDIYKLVDVEEGD